jgi:hypothetical protein
VRAVAVYWNWELNCDHEKRDDSYHRNELEVINAAREKYEIPSGVALIGEECPFKESDVPTFKKWIRYWVSGVLTEDDMHDMYFYFAECDEIDFCWVFMDKPSHYYTWQTGEHPDGFDLDELVKEWFAIGTRSPKKQTGKSFAEEMNPAWYRTPEERAQAAKDHPMRP